MNITLRLANYISRYAPSRRKVMGYLEKKNTPNILQLLTENGYDESIMCDMWMRSFVSLGKWKREMSMKLQKKEFPKEMILQKIEQYTADIHDWDSNRDSILNQIRTLEQRGKSRRMIASLIVSRYSYFKDEIQELLWDSDDSDNLEKEVQKYKNRYNIWDKKIREKMIASLLRKWFSYSDIKNKIS
jgi:SOS response regulatory protein OraA/RecX